MSGIGLVNSANHGLQAGIEQAQKAALDITRAGTTANRGNSELASISEASVDLLEAKLQTQSSARMLQTADQMIGSLLDITI